MKNLTTEDTENTERENDLQCELAAWELLREAQRERDEARERERVAIASWDEEHQRALREGERVLEARRERDEVRELHMNTLRERDKWEETARLYCQNSDYHQEMREKAERERDEARAAIPAGEWVAYKDHQKVHDAASRLLVAINKQLPIGCFILINSEYHRLQNAIYGREGGK
jgi:hypothetical protein